MMISFMCPTPSCGVKRWISDKYRETLVSCPQCGQTIEVPAKPPRVFYRCDRCEKTVSKTADCPLRVICPKCKAPLQPISTDPPSPPAP
jgi:uncharacterized paraquat-inducible protein A